MFEIILGGCGTAHPSSFYMSRPLGLPHYILLIIRTHAIFQIREQTYKVTPGQALLIEPDTPYYYGNPDGEYIDDWLQFKISPSADFNGFTPSIFPINKPFSVTNTELFTSLISKILWEHSYGDPTYIEQNIDLFFQVILNYLSSSAENKSTAHFANHFQNQLYQLRLEIQNTLQKEHSIQTCAARLGVSDSHFQHLYTQTFGRSFQQDLIMLRITHAKYILSTSDLTIEQIASLCGYRNMVHFYRQFRKQVGMTPNNYRKNVFM